MSAPERSRFRALIGASAAVWAGEAGVDVRPDLWVALSGATAVDFNLAVCHGEGAAAAGRDAILAGGRPGLVMLAGEALAEAQVLVESGWACVDAVPTLWLSLAENEARSAGVAPAGEVRRRLAPTELGAARDLIVAAFDLPTELGLVALPERVLDGPGNAVWGAFDGVGALVSCLIAARVENAVVVWSMATAAAARGRSHGARLLVEALRGAGRAGATVALLRSAPAALGFYRRLGFVEFERWQAWSRPRWVLGRA